MRPYVKEAHKTPSPAGGGKRRRLVAGKHRGERVRERILPETSQAGFGYDVRNVDAIESAPFLTEEAKRDIFYNNAARFLRLTEEEIARHQGR